MVNWLFVLCLVAAVAVYIVVSQKIKSVDRVIRHFEAPDRALAYFALFLGLQVLLQQTTNYSLGVVYQLSDETTRETLVKGNMHLYPQFRGIGAIVSVFYWLFAAGALFAIASLVRGTIRDIRTKEPDISQTIEDNWKVMKQVVALLERMEAKYGEHQTKQ